MSSHSEEPNPNDFSVGFDNSKAFALVSKKIVKKNIQPVLESRNGVIQMPKTTNPKMVTLDVKTSADD